MTPTTPTPADVAHLQSDVDRLSAHNRELRARVAALEAVEVAAHRLLAAKPVADREARQRLWAAIGQAEGVTL